MSSETVSPKTSPVAQKYQAIKNRLFLFNLFLEIAFLVVFIFAGFSLGLRNTLATFSSNFFLLNALYLACFCVLAFGLSLPLDFYEGFILEHRFGLSRQRAMDWLKDIFKKNILTLLIVLLMGEAVYYFLLKFSQIWWLLAAFFWFFITVALAKIFPQWILPLFFHPVPLSPGDLRDRLMALLRRYPLVCKDVFVLDFSKKTSKANAMVAGLGKTKEIFLSDTLVQEFSPEEIEVVLAHEIGHYVHRDTFKIIGVNLAVSVVCFYLAGFFFNQWIPLFHYNGPSDIAGLPLLLMILLVLGLFLLPVQNGYARRLERAADLFSLKATSHASAFISAMNRLGEKNLSEFSPPVFKEIFLYDHPPLAKRIKMAREYEGAKKT